MVSGTMCRGFESLQMRFCYISIRETIGRAHLKEVNAMDDFREWLSDNLRYILLGLAIIVTLVLLFFGIRFLTSVFGDKKTDENQVVQQQEDAAEEKNDKETEKSEGAKEEEQAPQSTEEAKGENILEKNAYPTVNALMQKYYTALENRDIQGLKQLVDQLDPSDESAISNSKYIEGYSNIEVYTKQGISDNSYVVFACYGHKYVGYDTVLPGVSCLYVDTKEDGSLYIVAEPSQEQQDYITEVMNDQDCQELLESKQKEYDDTLAGNQELTAYLSELGVEGSAAMEAEVGAMITVKSNCNVRKEASTDSDKLGELVGGQEVKKTGQEGNWIQIEFNGQTGYVRGDLFL